MPDSPVSTESPPNAARPAVHVARCSSREVRVVVLVLHGGQAVSRRPVRAFHLAPLRMRLLARGLRRRLAGTGSAVWSLRNRVRGWNEPARDSVVDANWALTRIAEEHPGARVLIVGHSLGGRTALRVAGAEPVVGVCALAPWVEPEEPVDQLAGCEVRVAHGALDRVTSARASAEYVRRAARRTRARFDLIDGSGHAMLRQRRRWAEFVGTFVRSAVDREEQR